MRIKTDRSFVPIIDAEVTLEGGEITISEPTETTPTLTIEASTTTINVPAGAREVNIYNAGGLSPATGTVNGTDYHVGRRESFLERLIGNEIILLPAFTIVCNGSLFEVSYRA